MAIRLLTALLLLWVGLSTAALAQGAAGITPSGNGRDSLRPAMIITPGEIELGALSPGDDAKAIFYVKNAGSGKQSATVTGPEGWTPTGNQNPLQPSERILKYLGSISFMPKKLVRGRIEAVQ